MACEQPDIPRDASPVPISSTPGWPAHGTASGRRNETALLQALTGALTLPDETERLQLALRESFLQAVAGLGADDGVLIRVRQQEPLDFDVVFSAGFRHENRAACRELRSYRGLSPALIRKAMEDRQPRLISGGLDPDVSPSGRPSTVLCAPITEPLTGGVVAILCFQSGTRREYDPEHFQWLRAYAAALGHALTVYASGRPPTREGVSHWRPTQNAEGPEIIGDSEATRQLGRTLETLLPSTNRADAPAILVTGESGTGKELVARYLHHHSPKRSRGHFQAFNCAGLRGDLAESKLFGHIRGAFTGAVKDSPGLFRAANHGVLLLDEVGELSPEGQALLLRVLETRTVQPVGETKEYPVDVQIVLATNRRLEQEVAAKRFREDLYYRVSGLQVALLPLRDPRRLADIEPLLGHYLAKHERGLRKKTRGLTREAIDALVRFSWPGNVRQLSNVCLRLVTHVPPGARIELAAIECHQPDVLSVFQDPSAETCLEDKAATYDQALRMFRRALILDRRRRCGNNAVEAAASLKLSGSTFYRYWSEARRPP